MENDLKAVLEVLAEEFDKSAWQAEMTSRVGRTTKEYRARWLGRQAQSKQCADEIRDLMARLDAGEEAFPWRKDK